MAEQDGTAGFRKAREDREGAWVITKSRRLRPFLLTVQTRLAITGYVTVRTATSVTCRQYFGLEV